MARIILGGIVGFISWAVLWLGGEMILSAIWPDFGAHQAAFQAAIEDGGHFTANSAMLLVHIVLGAFVSMIAGFVAVLISGEHYRATLVLAFLLLAVGLMKAGMSWPYVPIWYHILFTAMLPLMAVVGGKLKSSALAR